ncbi:hypothetical protein JCM5353_006766 [Sporobolomyces roseus]
MVAPQLHRYSYRAPPPPSYSSRPPSPAPSASPTSSLNFKRYPSPARSTASRSSPELTRKPSTSPAYTRPPSPISPFASRSQSPIQNSQSPLLEVFGDSFASVFTLLGSKVKVHKFTGASSRGLNNPNSSMQVGGEILRRIEQKCSRFILLQFGAVDLHLTYLWQLRARGVQAHRPSDFVNRVASDFSSFLSDQIIPLAQSTGTKVYVAGVLPPVVEDHYLESCSTKYIEKSSSVASLPPLSSSPYPHDLLTRRAMVKLHNQLVSQFCARSPSCLSFVDINKYLGSTNEPERVSRNYIDQQDPLNIHLIWERTIQIWCREIPILRPFLPSLQTNHSALERNLSLYEREKSERLKRETRGFAEGVALRRGRGW